MTKYKVMVKYVVFDFVEVELLDGQNENDAIEIAEKISCDRNLDEMNVEIEHSEILERN